MIGSRGSTSSMTRTQNGKSASRCRPMPGKPSVQKFVATTVSHLPPSSLLSESSCSSPWEHVQAFPSHFGRCSAYRALSAFVKYTSAYWFLQRSAQRRLLHRQYLARLFHRSPFSEFPDSRKTSFDGLCPDIFKAFAFRFGYSVSRDPDRQNIVSRLSLPNTGHLPSVKYCLRQRP